MPSRRALRGIRICCVLLASSVGFSASAQVPGEAPSPAQFLAPDQLENLVAPVALYPDQLLSQVLAASTYPLEIVEAQQWLRQNSYLRGSQLVDAARQQNWDASVQALVIFPDAMALLTRDVQWTTALGNAFLAQQADVLDAIQRLRARAENNGSLRSTPQEFVTPQPQGSEVPIEIRPSDPRMMYVPSYNPQNVWGPPAQGNYPQVGDVSSNYSSDYSGYSSGNSFGSSIGQVLGTAVNLASYFTGFGGLASGGWGWALNWLTHSVLLNGSFLSMFGFHSGDSYGGGYSSGGGYGAPSVWVHNPAHRGGVPYSNREVAGRFGGGHRTRNVAFTQRSGFGGGLGGHYDGGSHTNFGGGWRTPGGDRIGGQQFSRNPSNSRSFSNSYASNFGSASRGYSSPGYRAGGFDAGQNRSGEYGSGGNRAGEFGSGGKGLGGYAPSAHGPSGYGAAGGASEYRPDGKGRGYGAAGYPTSAMNYGSANGFISSQSPAWSSRNAPALRASNQHFSEARSREHFSAPRASSQHFSAPRVSRSHGSGGHGSGGHGSKSHSSGGHSHKH